MRKDLLVSMLCAAGVLSGIACGSSDSIADFGASPEKGSDGSATGPGGGGSVEAGSLTDQDAAGTPNTATTAGSVVLVHASRNLPAFRVCFKGRTTTLPLPDDKIMPNANVVGVDVGSAVHIGQLDKTGGSGMGDASVAPFDSGADSGTGPAPTGELSIIEEKLARQFYPQGSDASAWLNCGALVSLLQQNNYEGHGIYTLKGSAVTPAATSAVFVVVRGCLPGSTGLTKAECGADYTDVAKGNLAYDIIQAVALQGTGFEYEGVNASPGVPTGSTLTYTNEANISQKPVPIPNGAVSTTTSTTLPPDDAAFAKATFVLKDSANKVLLTQTLADVQARSSPRELPASFFGLRSTFVLFVVGDPAVADPTSTNALHLLAVPVGDPATIDPDSGAL
jgi:hypothetical protein